MMGLKDLYKICYDLSEQFGDEFSVPIVINNRLTSTLGQSLAKWNHEEGYMYPTGIEISGRALRDLCDEDIIDVVKHEWTHYYLTKTDPTVRHGHDMVFKDLCKKTGCNGDPDMEIRTRDGRSVLRTHKYTVICPKCGEIAGYDRMCRTLKRIDLAEHTACGTVGLTYEQNWQVI